MSLLDVPPYGPFDFISDNFLPIIVGAVILAVVIVAIVMVIRRRK